MLDKGAAFLYQSKVFGQAALAQLVEHIIRNDGVGCSNHPSGTIDLLPEFLDWTAWLCFAKNKGGRKKLNNRSPHIHCLF